MFYIMSRGKRAIKSSQGIMRGDIYHYGILRKMENAIPPVPNYSDFRQLRKAAFATVDQNSVEIMTISAIKIGLQLICVRIA